MAKKNFIWPVITLLFCGLLYVYKAIYISSLNTSQTPYNVYIKNHDTFATVIAHLDQKAKLPSKKIAMLYGKLLGIDDNMFVGEYEVPPNISLHDVLVKFTTGDVVFHKFTIIEGWNFYQLLAALAKDKNLVHAISKYNMPSISSSVEGAYFPETYFYTYPDSDLDILKRANLKMASILHREYEARKKDAQLASEYEALTIASLLEKEALDKNEKYAISGVIQNRLKRNMRLQVDAAVYYGLIKKHAGEIERTLAKSDIKDKSNLYNTYAYKGLPPGPIAMPSLASIRAACNPSDNNYLYYVVKNDNSNTHYFSLNYRDHKKAIRKYLQHS